MIFKGPQKNLKTTLTLKWGLKRRNLAHVDSKVSAPQDKKKKKKVDCPTFLPAPGTLMHNQSANTLTQSRAQEIGIQPEAKFCLMLLNVKKCRLQGRSLFPPAAVAVAEVQDGRDSGRVQGTPSRTVPPPLLPSYVTPVCSPVCEILINIQGGPHPTDCSSVPIYFLKMQQAFSNLTVFHGCKPIQCT